METGTDRAVRDVSPWQLITPITMPEARERELLDMVAYLELQVRVHAAAIEALQIAIERSGLGTVSGVVEGGMGE